jgi:hypothetical protein
MAKKVAKTDDARFALLQTLTVEQKDKLLLKLFRKDPMLVEKLAFEFFQTDDDLPKRRRDIEHKIDAYLSEKYIHWDTPGELMMEMRSINGRITEHVKITKDKFGEVFLTALMLNTAFGRFGDMLNNKIGRADTFAEYVVKKAENMLKIYEKLPFEQRNELHIIVNKALHYVHQYPKSGRIANEIKLKTQV